jgi:hypothetical protein
MRKAISVAAAVGGLAASGCIDTDAAVFVDATLSAPSATVTSNTLGTSVAGSFALQLHLGPRASGPGTVSAEAFAITNADQSVEIIPLEPAADRALPVTVEPDSDVGITFNFNTGADLLPAAKRDELCAAGGLRIKAVLRDSLQGGGATPAVSDVFQPSCM